MKKYQSLAVMTVVLLLAALLRMASLGTLPPGLSQHELETVAIINEMSVGNVAVFIAVQGSVQETFFHGLQAVFMNVVGDGLLILKLPALWAGMLTIALIYAFTRRIANQQAAILAAALYAVSFWSVLLSRLTIRESIVPLFTMAVLMALFHAFHIRQTVSPDSPSTPIFAVLGFLTASSLYVHWFGIFLCAMVSITVVYLFLTRQSISRRAASASTFGILISLILIIPYIITTFRDPSTSGIAAMAASMSPESLPQSIIGGIAALFPRGDLNPTYNLPGRPLFGPILATLWIIGMVQGLRYWRRPATFIPAIAVVIGLIPLLLSTASGSFLALVGILPVIFVITANSTVQALAKLIRRQPRLQRFGPWLLVVLVAGSAIWTGFDLFTRWNTSHETRTAYNANRGLLAHYLDTTTDDVPVVICSPRLLNTDQELGDPALLDLMMHQPDDSALRYVDCANGLVLAQGGEPQQFIFTDLDIINRMDDNLRSWLTDQPSTDVAGLAEGSVLALDIQNRLEDAVGALMTTAPTGWAPESPGGVGPADLPLRFGGNMTFLGYQIPDEVTYKPGDVVAVLSYWRADGKLPSDVLIFTHILSDPAAIVAQSSAFNTWADTLQSRDVFMQVNYITLPESIPAGDYDISIGAFQSESGLRLPVFDGERVRGDRLFLYQLTVENDTE